MGRPARLRLATAETGALASIGAARFVGDRFKDGAGGADSRCVKMGTLALVALLWAALPASAADPSQPERDESWWRAAMAAREAELASAEQAAAVCEEREAPPPYDGVDGYVTRGARDGRPRFVEVRRCDEERAARDAARDAVTRLEDEARRLDVPPGWLR